MSREADVINRINDIKKEAELITVLKDIKTELAGIREVLEKLTPPVIELDSTKEEKLPDDDLTSFWMCSDCIVGRYYAKCAYCGYEILCMDDGGSLSKTRPSVCPGCHRKMVKT